MLEVENTRYALGHPSGRAISGPTALLEHGSAIR